MSAVSGFDPILFDLDGTVIDSVALIRESHRYAVHMVLGIDLPDDTLVALVGRPLIDQMREFSVVHADELLRVYRAWNHAHTQELLRAYEGMDALLTQLTEAGHTLGVITSKAGPTVDLAFDVLPLRHHFSIVVASEDTDRHKPDPAPIHLALTRLGVAPDRACYVGDAPFDIQAAKSAGITSIGVTWGFFARPVIEDLEPDVIVDTIDELTAVLLGS